MERLVQMQLRDPDLETAVWEKELVEVWEAEAGSSLEVLLRPVYVKLAGCRGFFTRGSSLGGLGTWW